MMSLFFRLPEDLQIHVLNTWIASKDGDRQLLRASSALDVAWTNTAHRPAWLLLLRSLAFSTDSDNRRFLDNPDECVVADMLSFMRWIAGRKAAVVTLILDTANMVSLGQRMLLDAAWSCELCAVERVILRGRETNGLQCVLRSCPNITSISCSPRLPGEKGAAAALWKALAAVQLRCLRYLDVPAARMFGDIPLVEALALNGGNLETLRIPEIPYEDDSLSVEELRAIVQLCPVLQDAELNMSCNMGGGGRMALLTSLTHLTSLKLSSLNKAQVAALCESGMIARLSEVRLTLFVSDEIDDSDFEVLAMDGQQMFVQFLRDYPHLEHTEVGEWSYCRRTHALCLYVMFLKASELDDILELCPQVTSLTLKKVTEEYCGIAATAAERLGAHIEKLKLVDVYAYPRALDLMKCLPKVTSIALVNVPFINFALFDIAAQCPALTHLTIFDAIGAMAHAIYASIAKVLEKCPKLKEIKFQAPNHFANHALQAILDTRHRLQRLMWFNESNSCTEKQIAEFRQAARQLQLLPVLQVTNVGMVELRE